MTPEEIAAIRERAEAATEGPWFQGREKVRYESAREVYTERDPSRTSRDVCRADETDEDAAFIAHAREDVPRLIAEVERLTARLDKVRALHAQGSLHPMDRGEICTGCGCRWPCATIQAIDGSDQ